MPYSFNPLTGNLDFIPDTTGFLKTDGSRMLTSNLVFDTAKTSQHNGYGFAGTIDLAYTYQLAFAHVSGPTFTNFTFSYTPVTTDVFAEDLNFITAFNANATVKAQGFTSYNNESSAGKLFTPLDANRFVIVGPPGSTYTITLTTNGTLVDIKPTYFAAATLINAYSLQNVKDPTGPNDAASKKYIDSISNGLVKRDGSNRVSGDIYLQMGGVSRHYGWGWTAGLTGSYTLRFTPDDGMPAFDYNYTVATTSIANEATGIAVAFTADPDVQLRGFRAYHAGNEAGEAVTGLATNQFIFVGPRGVGFTCVKTAGNADLVDISATFSLAASPAYERTVKHLKEPTATHHAATKLYTDTQVLKRVVSAVSAATTLAAVPKTDYVTLVTGVTTITLPTAVGNSNRYVVKRMGADLTTINTTASQTIDGAASMTLDAQYASVELYSDGANWVKI